MLLRLPLCCRTPLLRLKLSPYPLARPLLARHTSTQSQTPAGTTALLKRIEHFLLVVQDEKNIEGFIKKTVSNDAPNTPSRHLVLERIITLLFSHHHFVEAGTVFQRMLNEGYTPSPKVEAVLLAVGLATSPTPESRREIMPAFERIFTSADFTEADLVHFLGFVRRLKYSPQACVAIIDKFIETRGDNYNPPPSLVNMLVGMQTRAGMMDEALATLSRYDLSDEAWVSTSSHPYVSALSALKDVAPLDEKSVDRVLASMQEKEIQADLSLLNILISKQLARHSLHQAFAVYGVLIELSATTSIAPDAYTFRSLFTALRRFYRADYQAQQSRIDKPQYVLSPRQLYSDMLASHFSRSRPHSSRTLAVDRNVDQSLLNVALQAFLQTWDHVGAFVVLQTFGVFGIPPNARTYYIVRRHILRRMRKDRERRQEHSTYTWAGIFSGTEDHERLTRSSSRQELVDAILALESRRIPFTIKGRAVLSAQHGRRKDRYTVPTLAMMTGETTSPFRVEFDIVPLVRMLRRALSTDLICKFTTRSESQVNKEVSKLVAQAKEEMIPTGILLRKSRSTRYLEKSFRE